PGPWTIADRATRYAVGTRIYADGKAVKSAPDLTVTTEIGKGAKSAVLNAIVADLKPPADELDIVGADSAAPKQTLTPQDIALVKPRFDAGRDPAIITRVGSFFAEQDARYERLRA